MQIFFGIEKNFHSLFCRGFFPLEQIQKPEDMKWYVQVDQRNIYSLTTRYPITNGGGTFANLEIYVVTSYPGHRVFANGPGDQGSIPGRVIPKTQKIVLVTPCLTLSIIR